MYVTVELTGLAPSSEATERITLEDEVVPLTLTLTCGGCGERVLRYNSVGVDTQQ